tara:strand:- start:12875 stop:13231 length:357 start_codon:yes stop_codon:yes gene_type:complete
MIELTKAEEQVMQVLWDLKDAFVKDIVEKFPEPRPAYNTVSTIIRILEKKKVVGYKSYGRTHQYFPMISKETYTKQRADNLLNKYFSGSMEQMLSFFVKEKNISTKELEKIMEKIDKL